MRKIVLLALIVLPNFCKPQMVRSPLSVRYIGIGTYSETFADVFSFVNNQAALSVVREATAGVYSESRFLLKELSLYQAAAALPVHKGGIGISATYTGFKNFSESQFGLAYGRALGEKASLGIAMNYNMVRVPGYGNAGAVICQLGCIFHVTEKLHAGWHVYNPLGGKFGKSSNEKIAAIYTMGFGYEISDQFFVTAEVAKEENQRVNISPAIHYAFLKQFFVRAGMMSSTANSFFGFGISWKIFRADLVLTWHPQLGFTPSALLILNFSQQKSAVE